MRRFSPYNYVFNNPIGFIDPDGMEGVDPGIWQQILSWFGVGPKNQPRTKEEASIQADNRSALLNLNKKAENLVKATKKIPLLGSTVKMMEKKSEGNYVDVLVATGEGVLEGTFTGSAGKKSY